MWHVGLNVLWGLVANKLQIAILTLRVLGFEDFEENGQTLQMQLKQIGTSKYNEL